MAQRRRRGGGGRRKRKAGGPRVAQEGKIMLDGEVTDVLPNTMFRVHADNGMALLVTLSGRMRRFYVRVLLGDRVQVEVSPYEPTKGRITYRYKS